MHQYEKEILIFIAGFFALFAAFFTGIILFIRQAKKSKVIFNTEKQMMEAKHMQEILTTQLEMQTQTMQHIGREIHDNVGQKLTLASLYTQQLAYENKAPQITDKIETISQIINESLAELRQLSKSLTDDTINDNNLVELLQQECDKVDHLKKCRVTFTREESSMQLPYQTKSILLRIVQEFLQNSMKHAECKNILVTLVAGETVLQLILKDDGKGFDTSVPGEKGIGLSNMKKRTTLLGGTFNLESKPGIGTQLHIEIPL